MGNESSKLKGLIVDKNAIEANDFWALYNAESPTTCNDDGRQLLSVFQGEPIVKGQLWVAHGPIERAIKNLKIYRHPYILKYVATWEENGQKHLATERVRPLSDALATQSDIQICLGLRTILCSLIFLIEKAMVRHLNICTQSIYVTENGSWRLAGFEYVWKSKEVNKQLLLLAHSFRCKTAIDESEKGQNDAFEQYAFAALCENILSSKTQDESNTPYIEDFRSYCNTHLKHEDTQLRPKLSAVLLHPYFNHEFVLIHSFLFELPLKSIQERQQFFTSLIDRLRYFNEQVVATQLATNLLSRMVLLDATAQLCVTPYVLCTKTEASAALFSQQTYIEYLLPHILKLFRLRDAQIRLILLEYFMEYARLLSEEQLRTDILPHLLAGMYDTNDVLAAKTLRTMADLVPILGAATVIGGQRIRIFSDGRPQAAVTEAGSHWVEPRSITPVMNGSGAIDDYMVSGSPMPPETDLDGSFNSLPQQDTSNLDLPLRLSPDGGEDNKSAVITDYTQNLTELSVSNIVNQSEESVARSNNNNRNNYNNNQSVAIDDEEAWSDWDAQDETTRVAETSEDRSTITLTKSNAKLLNNFDSNSSSSNTTQATHISQSDSFQTAYSNISTSSSRLQASKTNNNIIDDLSTLDIQVQLTQNALESTIGEFDFFKDMEPIIEIKNKSNIPNKFKPHQQEEQRRRDNDDCNDDDDIKIDVSRFAATQMLNNADNEGDGWVVDEEDDTVIWTTA